MSGSKGSVFQPLEQWTTRCSYIIQHICAAQPFEEKSPEELRWQDEFPDIDSLQKQKNALQSKYAILVKQHESMENEVNRLHGHCKEWNQCYSALKTKYAALTLKYKSKKEEHHQISAKYQRLQEELRRVLNDHGTLSSPKANDHAAEICHVFWDGENQPIPSGYTVTDIVKSLREKICEYRKKQIPLRIQCYNPNRGRNGYLSRELYYLNGVAVIDVPNSKPQAVDLRMIADMMGALYGEMQTLRGPHHRRQGLLPYDVTIFHG